MTCYHPIPAYQGKPGDQVRLLPPVGTATLQLPCGKCLGCQTARATEWAARAMHEASQFQHNCFLTLTYNEDNVPNELKLDDLQRFFKRLRKAARPNSPILRSLNAPIRYLACGEYGEQTGRPHYHALLFNCAFNDTHRVSKDLVESELLNKLWPVGHHRLGNATARSATYVAQYTMKNKQTNYADQDGVALTKPFLTMSLKPAIGTQWLNKYKKDLSHGYLVTETKRGHIPRTYKNKLQHIAPLIAEQIRELNALHQQQKRASQRDDPLVAERIHEQRRNQKIYAL